jgi:hypothetical protein
MRMTSLARRAGSPASFAAVLRDPSGGERRLEAHRSAILERDFWRAFGRANDDRGGVLIDLAQRSFSRALGA